MLLIFGLGLAALILAVVTLVQGRFQALAAWAILLLAIALILMTGVIEGGL